jgi:hypothetical protein
MIVRAPRWKGTSLRGLGVLNCPGDPGCPGYVEPGSNAQMISLLNEILANQGQMQIPPGGNGLPIDDSNSAARYPSLAEFLNANAGFIALGAGAVILLILGMRR